MRAFKNYFLLPGVLLLLFFMGENILYCQRPERIHNIFTNDAKFGYLLSPGIKLNSAFNKLTSEVDLYGGLLINEKVLLGAAAGVNVGYPRVNYGYIGIIGQYIYKPVNFIHYSWQTILSYGTLSVNDQGFPGSDKTTSGFYLMEPGANVEINLMRTLRLVAGISYRFVPDGLNDSSPESFFTRRDLRGLNFRIGIITGHLLEVLK